MKRYKMGVVLPLHLYIIPLFLVFQTANALRFTGAAKTYAKFPKWNACVNATFSFEFKTTQTDGLLMYTDDNGTYDYVEVLLKDGRVRLRMNIVDGKEGSIEMFLASRLNDNRWHRVEIQRNRMETTLIVDGISDSRVAFGSDFSFGEISKNNFVFFGGLPDYYYNLDQTKLKQLSLPSSYFEKRFTGEIRNVIYGNCTCIPVRGEMIEGNSVEKFPPEACETDNRCGICLCLSRDDGPGCRCVGLQCAEATVTHYHLPMDTISGETLENPSGLDTRVNGQPQIGLGVMLNSLTIEGKTQWIKVSGPGHRTECFGDLDLCPLGYTLSMWLKFENVRNNNGVYLSNGGHSSQSHGVAMLYKKGMLEFVFRKKDGKEWKVKARDVLPKRWYHVTATWLLDDGLSVYVNGILMDKAKFPVNRGKATSDFLFNDFYVGRANDNSGTRDLGTMVIDEFHFWSTHKNEKQVRDEGAVYRYYLSMDSLNGRKLEAGNLIPNVIGNVQLVPGKVGNGLRLFGQYQYVDLGSFTDSCIGNVSMCMFGFTISFWAYFVTLENNAVYVASGQTGFTVFSYGSRLYADVQNGDRQYQTSANGVEKGRWYFVEITWARNDGLSIYLDLELKAFQSVSTHVQKEDTTYDNFYIGRANSPMISERYANFVVDDLEVFNADRKTLLFLDYIQRGRPTRNYFELEQRSGTRIIHPSIVIETFGNPSLVSGKIGKSLLLDGRNQYADFGEHVHNCFGNLDNCPHGMMTALWFKPKSSEDGMQYLSSGHNGVNVIYRNGKFQVTAETSTRKWIVETTKIKQNEWNYLEISVDPGKGLRVFSDNHLIAENNKSEGKQAVVSDSTISDRFYLGRGNGVVDGNVSKSGAAIYDEMEYWYGTRDFLLAFGYIERGKPLHYIIAMDKILGSQLEHPSLNIEVFGNPVSVPGKIGKAITLNGPDQYINIGDHHDKCLGNLKKCPHGITLSVWIKFNDENNMYILSTGQDGIRVFYRNGYIYVTLETMEKSWRASAPSPRIREWHYLEISWHPEFGLNIYMDNKLKEHSGFRNVPPSPDGRAKMFYIGRPNEGDTAGERFDYSRMSVDEMEIWYGRREELLAFDYIVRDNIVHETFSMESATNNILDNPRFYVTLENGARLVPGKIGKAVALDGNGQFVELGKDMHECLANIDRCNHGITLSLWLNPRRLMNNTYYISSPTYSLFYSDGKLKSTFISGGKSWTTSTPKFQANQWQNIVLSWSQEDGLVMYVDEQLVGTARESTDVPLGDQARDQKLYIGKSVNPNTKSTADALVDEVEYWYSTIDWLNAHGVYGGQIHESFPLGSFDSAGKIRLPGRIISLHGNASIVQGQHSSAVRLHGKGQYIDLGEDLICGGNLEQCYQGFTMRFSTKPDRLLENSYFVDSFPVTVQYKDGKLYATVRTPTKTWSVSLPGIRTGEWQVVDVSWHPETGLTLHLNGEAHALMTHGTATEEVTDWDHRTFFGRSLADMNNKRYAETSVENFEVWNVRRDVLLSKRDITSSINRTVMQPITRPPPRPVFEPVTPDQGERKQESDETTKMQSVRTDGVVIADSGAQLSPQLQGSSSTSKIIRFLGNSYIQYDFNVLLQEPLSPVANETHTFQFITTVGDGLLWLFKGDNREVIHISLKNGDLLFVYDDGSGNIQQRIVRAPSNVPLNDFRWHSLKVEKFGTSLKFYIDGVYVDEMRTRKELQFVSRGNIYLGGTAKTSELTNGLVTSNFDGAITDIEFRKYPRPLRELIISLLQFVDTAAKYGDFFVLDRDKWGSGNWSWPTRAPPTQPPPPTLPPTLPTPITFISSSTVFALRDPLDMRAGGSIEFRFKTREPRGLLLVASGQGSVFFGMEIFDGNLYLVYNFGGASNRELIDEGVDDGVWHDVQIIARSDRVLVNMDGQTIPIRKQESTSSSQLYFHKVFFGGYDNYDRIPWAIYSRLGYKGCMESLKINGIGIDLHRQLGSTRGVVTGCRPMSSTCQTQPCARGYCRDMMEDFQCECANTPYRGKLCDEKAIVASWNGSTAATYDFTRPQNTHTNDLSVRFNTPLKNTLLFKTECDTKDDYIQAELEDGRVKVTVRVDGRTKIFRSGQSVNDYRWHTLSIRRRADDFKIWVDDNDQIAGVLGGENYDLKIDRIHFASPTGALGSNNYIGFMQNFMYEDKDLFDLLKKQTTSVFWITDYDDTIQPTYKPVTVTSSDTHFQLTPMTVGLTMNILFKFKTKETNGLILYNKGAGNDVIAVELSNGMIRLAYNLGGEDRFILVPTKTPLNDNEWHTVRILLNEKGQISAKVDDTVYDVSTSSGDGRLDLTESLYIAGLPAEMFQRSRIRNLIESRQGFRGCLASMDLNGAVPDLINFAKDKSLIREGCFNLDITCIPSVCGLGQCVPGQNDYWCNCNMTGYIGRPCSDYPVGYYFGSTLGTGLISYKFPFEYQTDYDMDNIAFGFMTEKENGILMRLDSSLADEYIQIALRNGHVVVESKTGEGVVVLEESRQKFNDGKYHTVRYIRTGTGSSLTVDSLSAQSVAHSGSASVFDKVYHVMIGGREDSKGAMMDSFIGIIGGAYWNGYRWLDLLKDGKAVYGNLVKMRGDVVLTNVYVLVKPTPSQPPPIFIPPNGEVPPNIGGGGIISGPGIGGSGSGGGPDIFGLVGPPGSGGIVGGATGVAGAGGPSALASVGLAGPSLPPLAMGSRAGAVVGAVIGTLAFLTSLMWALYGLKPGIPNIFSPGAGSASGGVTSISPPRATSNIAAVQAASAGGGVGGGGGGGSASKVTVVNGSAIAGSGTGVGAGGGAGGGSSTYTSYFQSTSTAITAGGGGAGGSSSATAGGAGYDTATLRATGYSGGADAGIVGSGGGIGSAYSYDRNYMTSTSSASGGGGGGGGMDIPDYDLPVSGAGTMSSNFKSSASKAYSTSTLASNYNYQVNQKTEPVRRPLALITHQDGSRGISNATYNTSLNSTHSSTLNYQVQSLKTVTINRQGQYMMSGGTMGGTVTPGAAGDEVRVDCCLMTSDGDNVVTGSSLGPPQVWNMQSGELMRIMKGDTVGSTHLHLVCGDRLLVGSVHADLEINEYSGRKGVFNHTLQIWDFVTGKPLEMAEGEYCSALFVMSDNDKILFGRTDKFGDATSIIAWDLMGNQPIKEMRYDAPVGNNDYISFLRLSKNDRYVVAGFTNSFDNFAEFLVFDMTLTSYNILEPGHLRLDANPECTAIMNNDEAVTGLRNGDLVIWNLRTGTASRQLLASSGAHAHAREVKAVALSDDGRYLVSGSADGTLKVWDMATERLVHALSGHSDEVWCASISPDNEIIVSGSNDGTIRLWRMKNGSEMCVFNTGVDIFQVTMSHDKGTIVALGDKYGARKLIMLQVVRTKIRRQIVS